LKNYRRQLNPISLERSFPKKLTNAWPIIIRSSAATDKGEWANGEMPNDERWMPVQKSVPAPGS
jgi:hypothetical protein